MSGIFFYIMWLILLITIICNVSEILFCILYADDTSVIIKDKDISIQLQTLNIEPENSQFD